ncbi:pyruvate dehydrogenase complex dihydrolipoamide acetyltransferase [bacterium]|nr:pyruvate dehydrogenase complex dihydrolipoamide acetyltransferase [bacterium]
MAEIIKLPQLSDTMEEGTVAKWHKSVGEQVNEGDLLADIETDKATMEYESFQEGILLYQGVEEGKTAKVNAILAIVGEKGEDFQSLLDGGDTKSEIPAGNEDKKPSSAAAEKKEKIDTSSIKATIVKMPKLSDTMKEGTVSKWHKKLNEKVESGELLADIETDKATMEFEAFDDGVLLYQAVEEGKSAEVDAVLAVIGEKGADYESLIKAYEQNNSAQDSAPEEEVKAETSTDSGITENASSATIASENADGSRIKASPLAKKMASEKGINLTQVKGTGDNGRITKRDIENFVPVVAASNASASNVSSSSENYEEKDISQMRKTIAKRLAESKFTAPHFYLTIELDMTNAIEARKAINSMEGVKVSFNDMVVKAAAVALQKHPQVNSSWLGDKIRINHHVNIGVAVAVEDGLLVPVVRYANTKQLSQIGAEVKDFAQRAKDKKLQPQDWEGSTFSISNLGMFGIDEFTAIVNPPNSCIMAVGAIKEVPVVKNGQIVPGSVMKVTLSCDHRTVDGAAGAAFLQTFKQLIENPVAMLA